MSKDISVEKSKVKKSVALSGILAGNTAICSVGRSGNDLHYRGYDIVELAKKSTFEEVAYLLIHGDLPDRGQLKDYMRKLKSLRGIPVEVKTALEHIPAAAHPMDVLRTACSVLGRSASSRTRSRVWRRSRRSCGPIESAGAWP